ncbi:MAG: hypothetical protein ACRDHL_08095, partial [Candidatus Promineifilaceae bacterium]
MDIGNNERFLKRLHLDGRLAAFVRALNAWLQGQAGGAGPGLTEARAERLILAAGGLEPVALDKLRQGEANPAQLWLALRDLLAETGLDADPALSGSAGREPAERLASDQPLPLLALTLAAFGHTVGYPAAYLDPAALPVAGSPAELVLRRAAAFWRRQLARSLAETQSLVRQLEAVPAAAVSLDGLAPPETPVAPLPPHFRPPVAVRYPEMARETLQLTAEETQAPPAGRVVLTAADVEAEPGAIALNPADLPAPPPLPPVAPPALAPPPAPAPPPRLPSRRIPNRGPLRPVRLRVVVQRHPDGPGLVGVQV